MYSVFQHSIVCVTSMCMSVSLGKFYFSIFKHFQSLVLANHGLWWQIAHKEATEAERFMMVLRWRLLVYLQNLHILFFEGMQISKKHHDWELYASLDSRYHCHPHHFLEIFKTQVNEPIGSYQIQHLKDCSKSSLWYKYLSIPYAET